MVGVSSLEAFLCSMGDFDFNFLLDFMMFRLSIYDFSVYNMNFNLVCVSVCACVWFSQYFLYLSLFLSSDLIRSDDRSTKNGTLLPIWNFTSHTPFASFTLRYTRSSLVLPEEVNNLILEAIVNRVTKSKCHAIGASRFSFIKRCVASI